MRIVFIILLALFALFLGCQPANNPPLVDAGEEIEAEIGETIILPGSAFDPDGDPLSYNWRCWGSSGSWSLSNYNVLNPLLFIPAIPGEGICVLKVSDGKVMVEDWVRIKIRVKTREPKEALEPPLEPPQEIVDYTTTHVQISVYPKVCPALLPCRCYPGYPVCPCSCYPFCPCPTPPSPCPTCPSGDPPDPPGPSPSCPTCPEVVKPPPPPRPSSTSAPSSPPVGGGPSPRPD